jgi:hypothetical protein
MIKRFFFNFLEIIVVQLLFLNFFFYFLALFNIFKASLSKKKCLRTILSLYIYMWSEYIYNLL